MAERFGRKRMTKVMIVEDEALVRIGLKTLVHWEEHGFSLEAEAANGSEALNLLEKIQVDIIITDIRMPVMDGLAMINEIRKRQIDCEIIVLSSYDDFQYVKKAMVYGVKDYIHKPTMTPENIISTLERVKADIEKKHSMENYHKLLNHITAETGRIVLEKIVQSCFLEDSVPNELINTVLNTEIGNKKFYLLLMKLLPKKGYVPDDFILLKNGAVLDKRIEKFRNARRDIVCLIKPNLFWTVLCENNILPAELQSLTSDNQIEGGSVVFSVSQDRYAIENLADGIRLTKKSFESKYEKKIWTASLNPITSAAVTYINNNYKDEISLEDVAESIHVNPSYLSRLFFKETGKTFTNYVTELRMNEAKFLLCNTDYTINKIAGLIGYSNDKYFMKVFKKTYNITPYQYKQGDS
jgi:two-component system, response regulator YesN